MKLAEILSDSHLKYDPVNVGTYNYSAYDFDYINPDGTPKKTSSLSHDKYDVQPYLKDGENYGNVPGLIYGNSKNNAIKTKTITMITLIQQFSRIIGI